MQSGAAMTVKEVFEPGRLISLPHRLFRLTPVAEFGRWALAVSSYQHQAVKMV